CTEVSTCDEVDDCICRDIYSNPYKFKIEAPANLPQINSVNPDPAPAQQLITLKGVNFGNSAGRVDFIDIDRAYVGELSCGESGWTDGEISVKIPEEVAIETGTKDIQIRVYSSSNLESAPINLTINSEKPGPGICQLSPNNGPVNTVFNLFGENFENDSVYDIVFENGGKVESFLTVEQGYDWQKESILGAKVSETDFSGNIYLANEDTLDAVSNQVGFRVGSCTNNSCLTGETCCSSGICKDIVEGCSEDADFGETEFSWMVSTGALPKYPKVIERSCDAENNLMASPAPMKNKRTVCKNSVISATFNTVMSWPSFEAQATETGQVVKVKTKQCSTPDTTGESIPNCDLDSCSDGDCITTEYATLTAANKLSDNICTTDVDDVTTCETVSRLEIDTPLVGNTWYQVEILGGEFGVAGATASGTDPVYTMPNSYRWKFKTKADDCLPTDIAITPAQGLIETVDEQEIYKVSGLNQCEILNLGDEDWNWQLPFESDRAKVELFGHLCRVYGDQYEICPVVGTFDVDKYISASEYVTVRKDFGIYQIKSDLIQNGLVSADIQTDKSNPITVRTSAAVNVETTTGTVVKNLTKDAGLLIDFIDPKVVNYFPRCDSACINTQIQAHFNTKMNATSVEAPANLKLYPCVTSECVTYGTAVNLNSANINYTYSNDGSGHYVNRLDINLAQDLSPDTSYRAIVMDDVTSVSGENLAGLNYSTQSGSGDCANREDDNENGKIDKTGGYDADGDEKVDFACGCFDSDSNSFKSYAKDPAAAKCKELIAIDFKCQNLVTDELLELTDDFAALLRGTNYTYYSPDKSCELAGDYEGGETVLLDSFSWTFRTKEGDGKCLIDRVEVAPSDFVSQTAGQTVDYVSTPFSVPDSCSATGQPLNAYQYDWDWSSVEDRIATVTAGTYNAAKPDFCSNSCLVVGNNEADLEDADKLCGNGLVDEGEECDTKIGEDLNPYCTASCVWQGVPTCGSLNKLYCQEDTSIECSEKVPINCTCTVPGYSLTPCCGNGILQDLDGVAGIDEECEAICVKDGQSCSYGDDGCVCTMPEGCNNKCLKTGSNQELCGNGVIENSEDPECDTAAGTNVGPYQTATVNPAINTLLADPANVCFTSGGSCLFNFNYLSLFTEGDTDIEAKAVEEAVEVTGSSELSYVTQQCLLPQVTLTDIKPTDNDTDVCTNSLIYATFDGKINPISLNRDSLKLTKEIPANETCPVDLPVVISHYGFDEGSGQSTYDSILNNQAEVVAGVFVDGQVGQALEFDGQDSVVKTSTSSFGQAKPWTVSAWINPASLAAEPKTIFTASADGSNESIGLAVFKGNILLLKTGEKGDPRINNFSGMRIPENVWSHIMISYDGLGNIFVNIDGQGKSKSTFSLVTKVALDDLSIGNRMENPQLDWAGFDGAIDEFTVFEQLLLKDEMTQYYQSITGDGVAVNSLNYKFTKNPVKAVKQSIYNGYQKVKLTVRDLLVKSGWAAAPKRCDVGFNFSVTENSFGNTEVLVVPHYLLGENTKYNLEFNSIENVCGKASSIGTSFTTGDEICRVNNVYINPADRFVTKPNVNAEYQAIAQNYDQPIQSIPNVYSWKWAWNSLDTSIANVGSYVDTEDPSKVNVASFNKNGQTAIEAKTIITDDTVSDSSTGGASVSGYSNLEVFICSKLWAPTDYSGDFSMYGTDSGYLTHLYHKIYNVGLFYCRDLGQPLVKSCYNGQACYDDADCAGIGDQLCRAPLVCSDGVTSCSSDTDCSEIGNGKCLMAGEHDDLPKLKVLSTDIFSDFVEAGQKTPANPDQVIKQCQDGIDNDLNGLSDLEDPKCNDANDNWEEPALLAQYFLSRTDVALDDNFDESEDVISLRIYENPEALAPELWYMKYAPNAGNISSLDIDCLESSTGKFCYQGGKEDNSVYIAAGNISTTGTLYNNIYLLGYNSGANSNTQNIFSQMIETIKFNINNLSEGTTGTTAKQSVMKDIRRVQDINLVHLLLDGYRSQNSNKVPQLESGTYVRGETFSVWPSWQRVFGSMLGGALPVDPDNHFVWEQATTNPTPQGEICQDLSAGSVELYCQGQKQCVVPGQWCSICPSAASDGDHDYDKYTCYSSDVTGANLPEFYSTVYSIISDNPVYHYQALGPNAYNIDFTLDGYAAGYNTEKQGFRFYNEFRVLPKRKTATGDICISGGDCDYIYK
ncbi:hypothetical protein HOB30_05745, partial [Candidatus Falkowbacteria bacterium]|nr:hypothetical protein [Candidatus Falkowbacteria bacterium]